MVAVGMEKNWGMSYFENWQDLVRPLQVPKEVSF